MKKNPLSQSNVNVDELGKELINRMSFLARSFQNENITSAYEQEREGNDKWRNFADAFDAYLRIKEIDSMASGTITEKGTLLSSEYLNAFVKKWMSMWSALFEYDGNTKYSISSSGMFVHRIRRIFNRKNSYDLSMQSRESHIISNALLEFTTELVGVPDGYYSYEHQFDKERGTLWEETPPSYEIKRIVDKKREIVSGTTKDVIITDTVDYDDKTLHAKQNNNETRREIGVDLCAWIEDLVNARKALALYSSWRSECGKSGKSLREATMELDKEAAERDDKKIVLEARRSWEWIGWNIDSLWI